MISCVPRGIELLITHWIFLPEHGQDCVRERDNEKPRGSPAVCGNYCRGVLVLYTAKTLREVHVSFHCSMRYQLRISYFWPGWNSYVPHYFQYKKGHGLVFVQNWSLEFLTAEFFSVLSRTFFELILLLKICGEGKSAIIGKLLAEDHRRNTTTTAVRKDARFISERHIIDKLYYNFNLQLYVILSEGNNNNNNYPGLSLESHKRKIFV